MAATCSPNCMLCTVSVIIKSVSAWPQGQSSATRCGGEIRESIMKSVLLLLLIKMMVVARSIHVMYYLMHRAFYGPHMSSSKVK